MHFEVGEVCLDAVSQQNNNFRKAQVQDLKHRLHIPQKMDHQINIFNVHYVKTHKKYFISVPRISDFKFCLGAW
jgi:hypothetical protein